MADQSTTPSSSEQEPGAQPSTGKIGKRRTWLAVGVAVSVAFVLFLLVLVLVVARDLSRKMACAGNIKAVGTVTALYWNTYPGDGSPPITWLIEEGYIAKERTICPSSGLSESNYVFVPHRPEDHIDEKTVIMYEPKSNHGGEGGNFLFGDGHVMFMRDEAYDELIRAATANSVPR